MGAGQSTPEMASSQASVCDFSKEQIVKLDQEIDKINDLILSVKKNKNYDKVVSDAGARIPELEGAHFANYMSTLTGTSIEDKIEKINLLNRNPTYFSLILEHLLYAQVKDILEEYKAILSSIKTLCEKYQSNCVADVVVEQDIDVIKENLSKAQRNLNLFNQIQIPDTIASTLKETIGIINKIINKINERFSNIDNIITEMKTICERTRTTTRLFSRAGGKTARSAYKKRKQMKMKMKNSNSRSKTRNNKKKYKTMVKV
jgi:hypothetical protein